MHNRDAARTVFAIASLLESQGANPYRVRAYRRAAINLLRLPLEAEAFADAQGELRLPFLGERLRKKLGELVTQGRMQFHQELLDELPRPLRELLTVPGIGPKTADRLMRELGIRTVWGVAHAARQRRLQTLRGIGPTRERQLGAAAEALLASSHPDLAQAA